MGREDCFFAPPLTAAAFGQPTSCIPLCLLFPLGLSEKAVTPFSFGGLVLTLTSF